MFDLFEEFAVGQMGVAHEFFGGDRWKGGDAGKGPIGGKPSWKGGPGGKPVRTPAVNIDQALVAANFANGTFARRASNGKEVCENYQKVYCMNTKGGCGRSHSCPKVLANGWACGGSHLGVDCQNH